MSLCRTGCEEGLLSFVRAFRAARGGIPSVLNLYARFLARMESVTCIQNRVSKVHGDLDLLPETTGGA